ncbi:hypothetical protein QQZ08_002399 [Neonectria magnoliae]|uniref:Chitin synthesis regulation, Congo red resistance, RCR protein n=1 Tax=Neonectria magnoliae TaxID=2732573 RepID=A0ABR1IE22_9HYPO
MAPVEDLFTRDYRCGSGRYYRNGYCYRSRWNSWGRWLVAGLAIGLFLLVLLSCLAISRRRRRRGVQPMYGTGWMAGGGPHKFGNHQNGQQMYDYNHNPNQQGGFQQQQAYGGYPPAPPPPAYGQQQQPQYTGTTFNANDGYYGNQQSGVQPPQGTYQREEVYSPPQGPPPGK